MRCADCSSADPSIHLHVCCDVRGEQLVTRHETRLVCDECAVTCLAEQRSRRAVAMRAARQLEKGARCYAVSDETVEPAAAPE